MQLAGLDVQILLILAFLFSLTIKKKEPDFCIFDIKQTSWIENIGINETIPIAIKKNVAARTKGRQQLIPYIIHQTNEGDAVPTGMLLAIENMIERNPEYAYRYYNKTERRELIQAHFGSPVLAAFDKVVPGAFKADIFRYAIVYVHGGCYFDSGLILHAPLRNFVRPKDRFITSPDGPQMGINNAFFCCQAKHPILDLTIRRIVRIVANDERGRDVLSVTGPHVIATAFKEYFNFTRPISRDTEYPNGVRTLDQQIQPQCKIYLVVDNTGGFNISYNKYPNYYADTTPFINQPNYALFWDHNNTYNTSISVVSDGNYSTEPSDGKE